MRPNISMGDSKLHEQFKSLWLMRTFAGRSCLTCIAYHGTSKIELDISSVHQWEPSSGEAAYREGGLLPKRILPYLDHWTRYYPQASLFSIFASILYIACKQHKQWRKNPKGGAPRDLKQRGCRGGGSKLDFDPRTGFDVDPFAVPADFSCADLPEFLIQPGHNLIDLFPNHRSKDFRAAAFQIATDIKDFRVIEPRQVKLLE